MRKSLRALLILVVLFSLFGCSDSSAQLKAMQNQIDQLKLEKQKIQNELDELKIIDYPSVYKLSGGAYVCPFSPGLEVGKIRFLSSTLIHVTGRDLENTEIFDNYYIVEQLPEDRYHLIEEVIVNEKRGPYKLDHLAATNFLVNIKMSNDLKSLNYSPYSTDHICTFVSDNEPLVIKD